MSYSLSLAHLSDLHFGKSSRFACDHDSLRELGQQCAVAVVGGMEKRFGGGRPDLVIVTGDLTQQAEAAEFDQAMSFFTSFQEALKIGRSQLVFLPGNHDVSWSRCERYFEKHPERQALEFDAELDETRLELFRSFKDSFYQGDAPSSEPLERGAVLYVDERRLVCIAALSSCEQETNTRHVGVVSKAQARSAMNALAQEKLRNFTRIVALHHAVGSDPNKVCGWLERLREQSRLGCLEPRLLERFESDALSVQGNHRVEAILQDRLVHLALHGHQHTLSSLRAHAWRDCPESCRIFASGSFGLRPDKLPKDQPNNLGLLRFVGRNDRLELEAFSLEYDPLSWQEGEVEPGCFRDTGRDSLQASFPLSQQQRFFSPGSKAETDQEPTDAALDEQLQARMQRVLGGDPALCEKLAVVLGVLDSPEAIAASLIEQRFESAWSGLIDCLGDLKEHLQSLKRLLFLLAQSEVKSDLVSEVREQLSSTQEINVFPIETRYELMAELILKTALKAEIAVSPASASGDSSLHSPRTLRLRETGIDSEKARDHARAELSNRFKDLGGTSAAERSDRLKGRLRAQLVSKMPFVLVHHLETALMLPYVAEFMLPPPDKEVSVNGVTRINEDTLYELIKIILEQISELQD